MSSLRLTEAVLHERKYRCSCWVNQKLNPGRSRIKSHLLQVLYSTRKSYRWVEAMLETPSVEDPDGLG